VIKRPFHNEASQDERRQVLKDTLYGRTVAEQGTIGGRFAAESKMRVAPFEYPRQPANSPWHNNPLPAEEPLGVDINAVEAVGTAAEIEQSLREARDGVDAPSMPESARLEFRPCVLFDD
jgi:hypothetical protein